MNKHQLLDKIDHEAQIWDEFLHQVGRDRMEQPGATGDWTFKDVVAHLSGWRSQTLARLEAARQGQTTAPTIWPNDWDEDDDNDLEKINQWIYEQNRDRNLDDVLAESRQQFRQIRETVAAIPEETLFAPNRFAWLKGRPLADVAHFDHFHEEHEPVLRGWLAQTAKPM